MEQQLLQEQKKPNLLAFQVAISYTIYYLAFIVITRMLKIDTQAMDAPIAQKVILGLLTWGVFIAAIVFAQLKHKRELGGYVTFGRAFSTGFKVAVYAGLFLSILMIVYFQFIDPAMVTDMVDAAIARAKTDKEVEAIQMTSKYMGVFGAFGTGIFFAFVGLLISLLSAAFIKKERPLHSEAE